MISASTSVLTHGSRTNNQNHKPVETEDSGEIETFAVGIWTALSCSFALGAIPLPVLQRAPSK